MERWGVCLVVGCATACSILVDLSTLHGSSDAAPAEAASGAGFCASRADAGDVLCADFDEGQLALGWTSVTAASPQSIVLSDASFVSAPAAAAVTATPGMGTADFLFQPVAMLTKQVTVDTEVLVPSLAVNEYFYVMTLNMPSDRNPLLAFVQQNNGSDLKEVWIGDDGGTSVADHMFASAVLPGMWQHLRIVVTLVGSNGDASLDVYVGSTHVIQTSLNNDANYGPGQLVLNAGVGAASVAGVVHVSFDNVVLDVQ